MDKVIGFTGHRPKSLMLPDPYGEKVTQALSSTADYVIELYQPTTIISGFALGWDTAIAESSIKHGIGLVAAIPFKGQESRWHRTSQAKYQQLLSQAKHVEIVSSNGYSPEAMQLRNQWIVDYSNQLVALWNQSPGGTKNCIDYAIKTNKPCFNAWGTFLYFYKYQT